jgi:TrmH family RNA methyltransferase
MKRVVLVRTLGPRNAGAVLRACANFAPAELWLVAPARRAILVHPEFEQMAHGVEDLRERLRVAATIDEALADCTYSVGFTARSRGHRWRSDWRDVRAEWFTRCEDHAQRVALVFGSEENGLTVEETDKLGELCYLPTSPEHTSLNLALAVGIVLSSLYGGPGSHVFERGARLADGAAVAYLKAHAKQVFGEQVARSEAARTAIEESIERIFSRAPIESRDCRAWHMMLRALGSRRTPVDFGIERQASDARRNSALRRRGGNGDDSADSGKLAP